MDTKQKANKESIRIFCVHIFVQDLSFRMTARTKTWRWIHMLLWKSTLVLKEGEVDQSWRLRRKRIVRTTTNSLWNLKEIEKLERQRNTKFEIWNMETKKKNWGKSTSKLKRVYNDSRLGRRECRGSEFNLIVLIHQTLIMQHQWPKLISSMLLT